MPPIHAFATFRAIVSPIDTHTRTTGEDGNIAVDVDISVPFCDSMALALRGDYFFLYDLEASGPVEVQGAPPRMKIVENVYESEAACHLGKRVFGEGNSAELGGICRSALQFREQILSFPHLFVANDRYSGALERHRSLGERKMTASATALPLPIEDRNDRQGIEQYEDEIGFYTSFYGGGHVHILFKDRAILTMDRKSPTCSIILPDASVVTVCIDRRPPEDVVRYLEHAVKFSDWVISQRVKMCAPPKPAAGRNDWPRRRPPGDSDHAELRAAEGEVKAESIPDLLVKVLEDTEAMRKGVVALSSTLGLN